MRFDLRWQSEDAMHTETRVFPRLDLLRDIFPAELESDVMDRPVGHCAARRFEPGTLVPSESPDLRLALRAEQLKTCLAGGGRIDPRAGRFYPRGILTDVEGISAGDRRPFRLVDVRSDGISVDLNHPLANRTLDLALRIEAIQGRAEQRGGRCSEVHERVTADGPGMQARWRGQPTDFWAGEPFARLDESADAAFYAHPRLVDHLDRAAIAELTAHYARLIPAGSRVLDLMTSWHSHLDPDLKLESVIGLGMNQVELEANPVLTERLVHDLNRDPSLPFGDACFSTVVCTVSVEYLIRPFEVFREIARVLEPGGCVIVSFSNRWFPPKVIRIWQELHAFERLALVLEYLRESSCFGHLETWSLRGIPRPPDDKYAERLAESDPVYAVWGTRV